MGTQRLEERLHAAFPAGGWRGQGQPRLLSKTVTKEKGGEAQACV
jgi:hypothetical protein